MTCILIGEGNLDTEEIQGRKGGRDCSDASINHGMPSIASNHQKLKGKERSSPRVFRESIALVTLWISDLQNCE